MLSMEPLPTAVIAGNHLLALGALEAIRDCGRSIPGEVALASFDDPQWAAALLPGLTTMKLPAQEMGETAARLMLERIETPRQAIRQIVLEAQLVSRESA